MTTYNYSRLFETITAAVGRGGPIADRMQAVIRECVEQRPHADWERIRDINFSADAQRIEQWLECAFPESAAKKKRDGLWFGLFNPSMAGNTTADIYVAAAPEFDQSSIEWACDIDRPHAGSYLGSTVLSDIYSIAYTSIQGLGNDTEYPLALAYGGMVAHSALTKGASKLALNGPRGAAVGFDSGDFFFLGEFDKSRFVSKVRGG